MKKILASTASIDSAKKLRDAIEDHLGLERKTILVTSSSEACRGHDVIMRYGCGYGNLGSEPVWGSKAFTAICIDKRATAAALTGLCNVPVFVDDRFPESFPVLVRNTLTGSQSEGIHITHNADEMRAVWRRGSYWTKYFTHTIELRVNVVFDESGDNIRIYKKVPRSDVASTDEFIAGDGGRDNVKWVLKDTSLYPKVERIVSRIHNQILSLGGKFVGIDMIYVPELNDYVVLEMNSGPWLTQSTAEWLAEIFVEQSPAQTATTEQVNTANLATTINVYDIMNTIVPGRRVSEVCRDSFIVVKMTDGSVKYISNEGSNYENLYNYPSMGDLNDDLHFDYWTMDEIDSDLSNLLRESVPGVQFVYVMKLS